MLIFTDIAGWFGKRKCDLNEFEVLVSIIALTCSFIENQTQPDAGTANLLSTKLLHFQRRHDIVDSAAITDNISDQSEAGVEVT